MSETMRVRPAPGLLVRRPDGTPLPPEGAVVPRSSFWLQCLADGDVREAQDGPAEVETPRKVKGAPA